MYKINNQTFYKATESIHNSSIIVNEVLIEWKIKH
ncbi:hypothetical protein YBT020_09720 [Bacillus thuringiensis serovar finitimus YBT-020]|nr:hypothetical protein YBT020_09720 [Bacillus thuringiensis serovar finitimus YBT-020]